MTVLSTDFDSILQILSYVSTLSVDHPPPWIKKIAEEISSFCLFVSSDGKYNLKGVFPHSVFWLYLSQYSGLKMLPELSVLPDS